MSQVDPGRNRRSQQTPWKSRVSTAMERPLAEVEGVWTFVHTVRGRSVEEPLWLLDERDNCLSVD